MKPFELQLFTDIVPDYSLNADTNKEQQNLSNLWIFATEHITSQKNI
jgi:hypothetical protein